MASILTLCCPFLKYNNSVERTLISFEDFVYNANKISKENKFYLLGITSNKLDLLNKNISKKFNSLEYIPNNGVYFAFNNAIKKSFLNKSNWLWIIGEGDTINIPTKKLLKILKDYQSQESIIIGSMIIGNRVTKNKICEAKLSAWLNLDKMRLNHPAMIISTKTYKKIGKYNENRKIISDYEWCLKALRSKINLIKYKNCLTYHELGGISTEYGKSRLTLHLACIKVVLNCYGASLELAFAIITRLGRFLISRLILIFRNI